MSDLIEVLNYFKKLNKVIAFEADFSFGNTKLVKKNKIDDVLCCILATLPSSYKNFMNQPEGKKLNSILSYDLLFNAIKNKFILNPNVYLVKSDLAAKYINTIVATLEQDIAYIEKIS